MRSLLTPRLLVASFGHFTIDAYSSFFSPLLPLLVDRLHLNLTLVGTLVALSAVSSSFGQVAFGLLSDRMARPWFVALGPLVAALFIPAIGLAPSYGWLVALLLAGGLGVAAFHPQGAVVAREATPRPAFAMSIFVTCGTLGFALGPLFAVTVVGIGGLERTWLAAIPGLLLSGFLFLRFRRLPPVHSSARTRAKLSELAPHLVPLSLLYGTVVCRSAVSYGFMTFLPIHLHSRGFDVGAGGWITTAYLTFGAFGGFFGGWLAERWGGRAVVRMSFAGALPLYLAFPLLSDVPGILALIAGSLVLQSSLPVNVVLGQELSPRHASAISSLLMGAAWGVGALLIGPVGALADHSGLQVALLALASLLIVGFGCALVLPDLHRRAPLAAPDSAPLPFAE